MPGGRLRSQSTSSPRTTTSTSTSNSPLLSRGFASLRRSHHRATSSTATQSQSAIETTTLSPITTTPTTNTTTENDTTNRSNEHHIRLVPNVGVASRCFVFDIIDRNLDLGTVLKLGRYSERNASSERISFKSKVVSRCHAEIWQEDGKIYIKDSGSSSGTFVNRARLSPANTSSRPYIIQDGDLIQLGVDYKGGVQPMYRAVRMRLEVNRLPSSQQAAFTRAAFRQIKQCLRSSVSSNTSLNNNSKNINELSTTKSSTIQPSKLSTSSTTSSSSSASSSPSNDIQECCICLYNMLPGQALFIAPCSHIYHYKCLRPILIQNFPGFSCPLCRTYSDLDASVTIEKEEMESMLKLYNDHDDNNSNNNNTTNNDNNNNNNSNEIITEEIVIDENNHNRNETPSDPSSDTDMDISHSRSSELILNQHQHQQKSNSNGLDHLLSSTLVGSPPQFELLISPHHHQPALPTTTTTTALATTSQMTSSTTTT